jgi:hypothetical protein
MTSLAAFNVSSIIDAIASATANRFGGSRLKFVSQDVRHMA